MKPKAGHIWIKIQLDQQGPIKFPSMYGNCSCAKVDLPIDLRTPALWGFPCSIGAAGYSQQGWSVYSDSGVVSPLSKYNSLAGRIPPSTSRVWMGESSKFFSFKTLVEWEKNWLFHPSLRKSLLSIDPQQLQVAATVLQALPVKELERFIVKFIVSPLKWTCK